MKYIKQLVIILSISLAAEWMEYVMPLPITASVYGLVLMLLGLVTGIIPLKEVEGAADFLIEIMPVLFVPVTAGIMTKMDILQELLLPLTVISLVTTVLVMVTTGRTAQAILHREQRKAQADSAESGKKGVEK